MNIGFIGTGNMAGAMIKGLVNNNFDPAKIHIMNRTYEKAIKYAEYGINVYKEADEVINASDIIILGIKPNQYETWLSTHELKNKTLISIAAGISSTTLQKYVDKFIITMPNTPSILGLGTTLLVESPLITTEILAIFKSFGTTKIIAEEQLPVYMLVTGCAPAYFFSFVDNLSEQLSQQYGLNKVEVESLLLDVLNGSNEMLKAGESAKKLMDNVCSPNGVTIQVVDELNKSLPAILTTGFTNALIRNEELSK